MKTEYFWNSAEFRQLQKERQSASLSVLNWLDDCRDEIKSEAYTKDNNPLQPLKEHDKVEDDNGRTGTVVGTPKFTFVGVIWDDDKTQLRFVPRIEIKILKETKSITEKATSWLMDQKQVENAKATRYFGE